MKDIIRNFSAIRITDTAIVGGKNASLGEMTVTLGGEELKYRTDLPQRLLPSGLILILMR